MCRHFAALQESSSSESDSRLHTKKVGTRTCRKSDWSSSLLSLTDNRTSLASDIAGAIVIHRAILAKAKLIPGSSRWLLIGSKGSRAEGALPGCLITLGVLP